jgi:hypothetical protein
MEKQKKRTTFRFLRKTPSHCSDIGVGGAPSALGWISGVRSSSPALTAVDVTGQHRRLLVDPPSSWPRRIREFFRRWRGRSDSGQRPGDDGQRPQRTLAWASAGASGCARCVEFEDADGHRRCLRRDAPPGVLRRRLATVRIARHRCGGQVRGPKSRRSRPSAAQSDPINRSARKSGNHPCRPALPILSLGTIFTEFGLTTGEGVVHSTR